MIDRRRNPGAREWLDGWMEAHHLLAWRFLDFPTMATFIPFSRGWRGHKKLLRVLDYVYAQVLKEGWKI